MSGDDSDKTEEPTGRKLSGARDEGQVAQSQEIKLWTGLVGVLVIISMMSPYIGRDVVKMMLPFIEHPHEIGVDRDTLGVVLVEQLKGVISILLMPLALMMLLGIVSNISQVGLMWVTKGLTPSLDKFSPMKGIKRIFSAKNLVDFAKSVIKIGVIGFIIYLLLKSRINDFVALAAVDIFAMLTYLRSTAIQLIMTIILIVTALAAADWFYQRWSFMQGMRMTKQEVKDEHKQSEGDPMIKSRLRSLRMQRARQRMMAAVPSASVVITNPTHYAVALKYDMEAMGAPVLVAKGADLVAKRIRELADENEVPIVENPPLARALFATVELDQEVPPEHYKAVAEVIGYVMKLKGRLAN
ncbi:flagellar biosynthesis protein FlhB [Paramagnetospirillum marisnigri]|uniref:Flagellar biosynthetic protein FlhB n=1 Tax=Paramagnetospirillum marisnigri TaxID=1285242 RepID=A0A178MQK9_9PROT|nr:flagellar biosynthesis protein FlhB [Paramagnetospirillum marisnigri]OAN50234.1 flagellar biosynthesis protein FlhB [Paramagnetospirillum marisnigri]